ncbi:PH domain-containing protein [Leucobacter denitrificans]|uniref:PH domain-containing protein n=1 Tax=Leucobacter denitrificans TaxID=683042 RepID=UPI001FE5F4ED|nr:PH domain-containing protein [Leucobacter denitrificans]
MTHEVNDAGLDLPGTPNAEGWRRLHPLSPVLRGGIFFLVIVGVVIANLRDVIVGIFVAGNDEGDGEGGNIIDLFEFLVEEGLVWLVVAGVLGIILFVVLLSWVAWRFQTYRVSADTVEARSGVLFRQHRRAPLDRIQSVNLQRSLLARIVGLTKIEVLTGGQGGKVELAYLGHRDAKTVREQILQLAAARREGRDIADAVEEITGTAPVSYDGSAYAEATDAFTGRAQDFVDFDVDPEAAASQSLVRVPVGRLVGGIALSWETVFTAALLLVALFWGVIGTILGAVGVGDGFFGSGGAALLTLIPLVLVMIAVIFGQFNKGFNFTLSRGKDAVRVGAGLTSTVTDSIPFGRIHAIEARQPLFWRPFGWWRVRVTVAGHSVMQGGQSATQNLVLPVGPEDDVIRVIETLVPGTVAGLRDGLSGPGDGYIGAGPRSGWVLWFGKARAGVRIDVPELDPANATLRIRRGYLTRSLSIMPVVRAQSIQLRRPMVHYWLGLASIQAHTVMGPVNLERRGLALADARRVFDELERTILEVQRNDQSGRQTR